MTEKTKVLIERIDALTGQSEKVTMLMANAVSEMFGAMPEVPDGLSNALNETISSHATDIKNIVAAAYATHFTDEELEAVVAFHASPAGRRMRELAPVIEAEISVGFREILVPAVTRVTAKYIS